MQQTTNYNLKKIELTDSPPDITVLNPNWDTVDAKLKLNEEQINNLDANKANKVQEAWITATLGNGWTGTLQYAKNDLKLVTVRGLITVGTKISGTILANLPAGYRPYTYVAIGLFDLDGYVINGLSVTYDGNIKIYKPASSDGNASGNVAIYATYYSEF